MKSLELKSNGLQELTRDQLLNVTGGGIFTTLLEGTLGKVVAVVGKKQAHAANLRSAALSS